MNNVRILDCTLRDGGRIINCEFSDNEILDISRRLAAANIDIIEVGFLRDWRNVHYEGNSTFFTHVEQIRPFIDRTDNKALYVAFVDYGMFDFDSLSPYDGTSIDGLRVGFTKKNYLADRDDIIKCLKSVKEKGYKLFIQGVNTPGYSDAELLQIIDIVNDVKPYGFGIVDTYGSMYVDDIRRIYDLVDHNLDEDIVIDFHSHNNFQLSFSFAQEIIQLSRGIRQIVIDATLNGMGKCAGNLNTELIVDFLVRKKHYNYDLDSIFDIIDDYMYAIKQKHTWGYSIPALMAGIYRAHPNNVIYLTEKMRLATKDIKHILSMIEPSIRQRYDYDNIQRLYVTYNHTKVDDKAALSKIKALIGDRALLLLLPGASINTYGDAIRSYIAQNNAFVISVNFITDMAASDSKMAFFGSEKRYAKMANQRDDSVVTIVSNILRHNDDDLVINYESVISRQNKDFDNTMIMLLNLLHRIGVTKFAIAGFDGYDAKTGSNYFVDNLFNEKKFEVRYEELNSNMKSMLREFAKSLPNKADIRFLTPSIYESIFSEVK